MQKRTLLHGFRIYKPENSTNAGFFYYAVLGYLYKERWNGTRMKRMASEFFFYVLLHYVMWMNELYTTRAEDTFVGHERYVR